MFTLLRARGSRLHRDSGRLAQLYGWLFFLTMRTVIKMKKLISLILCLFMGLSLTGCSQKVSSVQVQEGVDFSLVDVLEVDNKAANTVFFYFLAGIDNQSDQDYHMSNLNYALMAPDKNGYHAINPIDQYKSTITNDLRPGMSTYVYGYIGVPKTGDRNIGLYVKSKDAFLPFDAVKIRKISEDNIVHSTDAAYTIYEDEYYEFDVDASELAYHYDQGNSTIDGLKIHYKNKTDDNLVIPFLSPICTIDGFRLDELPNGGDLKNMNQEEISKQDFSSKGMQAKTEPLRAQTLGYELFYLLPEQEVTANVSFLAEGVIPDFSAKQKNGITININSPSLGYSQIMKVPY